jgi:hypothetical protein
MEEVVVVEEVISKWWVRDGDLGRPGRAESAIKSNEVNNIIGKGRIVLTNNSATIFKI